MNLFRLFWIFIVGMGCFLGTNTAHCIISTKAGINPDQSSGKQLPKPNQTKNLQSVLTPGVKPIQREITAGEKHSYLVTLKSHEYLNVVVEQKGIDLVVRLVASDGKILSEVDSPNENNGPEPVLFIPETSGKFHLEIEPGTKDARPGQYEVSLNALRPATQSDIAEVEITGLLLAAQKLRQANKMDQGTGLAQRALNQSENVFGPDHILAARSLQMLACVFFSQKDAQKAEPLLLRAIDIWERAKTADPLELASCYYDLAEVYRVGGDLAKAVSRYQQALNIWEARHGLNSRIMGANLAKLADVYRAQRDFSQAAVTYQRSLTILEQIYGPDHLAVEGVVTGYAGCLSDKGDFAKSELLYLRALAIREKKFGPDHPQVATTLNNLAAVDYFQGHFTKAEPLYQRALIIREKAFGSDDPIVTSTLSNLASLYHDQGNYTKAEVLFNQVISIQERTIGKNHPDFALSLNNLGALYYFQGNYAQAEPLYLQALAIYEKTVGPNHPNYALSLNNLAGLYTNQGEYTQAEALYLQSLAIWEKLVGAGHPNVALSLNNLGAVYFNQGNYAKCEPLYQRSLAINEKIFGKDHPAFARSLNNLATLCFQQKNYSRAESLFQQSLTIWKKTLGPDHPQVALCLNNLARLYWVTGDIAQAITYQSLANETTERDLARNLVSGSEQQKLLYLDTTSPRNDQTISLQVQAGSDRNRALQNALTLVLRRKGRALDAMAQGIEALRQRALPEDQLLFDELAQTSTQLSNLNLKGPGKAGLESHRAAIQELETKLEQLQNQVSVRSVEFRIQVQAVTLEAIQKAVPPNAALVEFATYRPFDNVSTRYGNRRYVVYVLTNSGEPKWADLGEAKPIDDLVATFRKTLSNRSKNLEKEIKPLSRTLNQLVMKPVRSLIGNATHLILSPDGALNLIPFAALVDEQGKFLVETYLLTYMTSGRDLLRLEVNKSENLGPPLVLANPDYSTGTGPKLLGQSFHPLSPLAGSQIEGNRLKTLFPEVQLKTGSEATETLIKKVRKPVLMHIATHGYFLEDAPQQAPNEADTSLGQRNLTVLSGTHKKLRECNPLLRSGLFFAGANQGGSAENDGVMTALEATQLNLWGTKLVVLSACDTGLGDVQNGDGVYGLRRALVLAGSEAQMMSLWPVSDQGTQELMDAYYTRLKAGEGRSDALRNVQLKMLKDLKRRHPFYWASFIQSGDWRVEK